MKKFLVGCMLLAASPVLISKGYNYYVDYSNKPQAEVVSEPLSESCQIIINAMQNDSLWHLERYHGLNGVRYNQVFVCGDTGGIFWNAAWVATIDNDDHWFTVEGLSRNDNVRILAEFKDLRSKLKKRVLVDNLQPK